MFICILFISLRKDWNKKKDKRIQWIKDGSLNYRNKMISCFRNMHSLSLVNCFLLCSSKNWLWPNTWRPYLTESGSDTLRRGMYTQSFSLLLTMYVVWREVMFSQVFVYPQRVRTLTRWPYPSLPPASRSDLRRGGGSYSGLPQLDLVWGLGGWVGTPASPG